MSVPARRLPERTPARRTTPAPRPAPAERRTTSRPGTRRTARRRFHPAFWALTALVLTAIVVSLVSVSAFVVETGFGIDRTEARIAELLDEGERLRRDVAEMSAPGRVARWAKRSGLVMPEEVVVLQVPGGASGASDRPEVAG